MSVTTVAPAARAEPVPPPEVPAVAPARVRSPVRAHPAWIVVAVVAAALVHLSLHSGISGDAWWQWAAGKWMLAHHQVIRRDVFSYTVRGRPWVAEEWGFEVALAWLVRSVGGAGFWLLSAGPCVAALLVGVARWRRLGAGMLRTAALAIVAGAYLVLGQAPRPQTLSYLCFSLLLLVLTVARRRPGWLVTLPVLLCAWANLHGSFLAGLVVLGLEAVLAWVPPGRSRLQVVAPLPRAAAAGALVASSAASLINPHGTGLLSYVWHVTSAPQLSASISEWQSPNFHSLFLLLLVVGPAALTVASLGRRDLPVDVFDLLLWGALLIISLHSQRFLPYAGLAWCGLAARAPARPEGIAPSLVTWPLAALGVVALVAGPHVPAGEPARTGPAAEPVAALNWLSGHPGRVFSEYSWDDYLIARGRPVFVDGRTDLYFGTGVLSQYLAVAAVRTPPDPVLRRWDVRYVLWSGSGPLAVYLAHDPQWRVAFRSGSSVVFGPAGRAATAPGP